MLKKITILEALNKCMTTIKEYIGLVADKKVDKVEGKCLTTNDLTNQLVENYNTAYDHSQEPHAPSNAQKNSDITKAEIEAKLTGQIDTHFHDLSEDLSEYDRRLDVSENKIENINQEITNTIKPTLNTHETKLNNIETVNTEQNNRLEAIEIKNQEQDNRINALETNDKIQDLNIKALFTTSDIMDIEEEGNSLPLHNSKRGFAIIDEIKGNTLVNCNKEPDKELILNGNINTSGDNAVTITEGVDGGLVDVALEGNTLVNVSKTKDSTAISKAYTVENSGNHIALQGDADGDCRPVITGNTLVNLWNISKIQTSGECSVNGNKITCTTIADNIWSNFFIDDSSMFKPSTDYTFIINITKNTLDDTNAIFITNYAGENSTDIFSKDTHRSYTINGGITGLQIQKLTTCSSFEGTSSALRSYIKNSTQAVGQQVELNMVILEGDYTNKPIPNYFAGLQSSFEDNLVTQEMVDNGEAAENLGKYKVDYVVTGKNKFNGKSVANKYNGINAIDNGIRVDNKIYDLTFLIKDVNKQYTISWTCEKISGNGIAGFEFIYTDGSYKYFIREGDNVATSDVGKIISNVKITYNDNGTSKLTNIQLEEGDTATPYEPYKEYKKTLYLNSPLLEGDTIAQSGNNVYHIHRYWKYTFTGTENWIYEPTYSNDTVYGCFFLNDNNYTPKMATNVGSISDILPSIVINSSQDFCLEGVACNGATIGLRINKSKLSTEDLEGFKQWLQQNPTTIVYQLAEPVYELISQNDTILCDSYKNGHLDVDSVVPIDKVDFLHFEEELTYLYPSTQYAVQFVSDAVNKVDITLGGAKLLNQDVVLGINKYMITTPSELIDNNLVLNGEGFNASNIVVTNTNREFKYFEGMKSVGECEDLEVVSCNKNLFNLSQAYIPFGSSSCSIENDIVSILNIEYIHIRVDSYIKANTNYTANWTSSEGLHVAFRTRNSSGSLINGGKNSNSPWNSGDYEGYGTFELYINKLLSTSTGTISDIQIEEGSTATDYIPHAHSTQTLTHEPLRSVGEVKDKYVLIDGKWYIERNCGVRAYQEGDIDNCITDKINTVYPLQTPTYEPLDYSPFEVYSEVTHITTNSTIPCNMTIKNTGYNCLLKPSTTYTISSNLGLNTVTTPAKLTEDCLRFYDTDTSDVTTMKDVLVLEGDWTTKADLIPANFSGIESAFEQEYDAEKGKYKVNVKVANEDKTQENNITFYINEPLRGIGNVKDRIYVKDDKVVVQRNCGIKVFNGSPDENWRNYNYPVWNRVIGFIVDCMPKDWYARKCVANLFNRYTNNLPYDGEGFSNLDNDSRICIKIDRFKLQTQDVTGFKQWLQQNPTTVVYQLAEPTYEEVEYNDTKLFIESFKNSTLFYNSNVPVTSKVHYSYSVPLVDKVSQTANISDEQDSMIIDLATQCAVMEIMLM